ncbi:MAG: F0F1 ATP synthase subunit epsilon [Thiotrichaceae bacterium]|nr:F0F1 ATP synthase subunit epsilon [Thiotrichaceae bacterium]
MAMLIHVDVLSTKADVFSGLAEMVIVPAKMGDLGILPCHTPLLSPMKPGEVRIKKPNGVEEIFYVSGGMLEVLPNSVTILADTVICARDIDEVAALEAKHHAEKTLSDKQNSIDYTKVHTELAEAIAQLQTVQRLRELTSLH